MTNDMYNFVKDSYDIFYQEDRTTLKYAWSLYKEYCEEANVAYPFSMKVFREELKSYFSEFSERKEVYIQDLGRSSTLRNVYSGFLHDKLDMWTLPEEES